MTSTKQFRRPRASKKRFEVKGRVDQVTYLTLDMLGLNVPAVIEIFLTNIANEQKCPCCERPLTPVIRGRTEKDL